MRFTREPSTAVSVQSVGDGEVRIGGEIYRKTVALTTTEVLADWQPVPVDELTPDDLSPITDAGPEVVVIGTGTDSRFAPREVLFALARRGIGLEVMDTSAAARTFNVLAGEGREVAAILYL